MDSLIPLQAIQGKVHHLRGQWVICDFDLAQMYEVPTKALNQAIKRNLSRFPEDFMFQITAEEMGCVNRLQFVTTAQKNSKNKDLPKGRREAWGFGGISLKARSAINIEQKYNNQFHIVFEAIRELMALPSLPKKPMGFLEEGRKYQHG